MTRYYTFHDQSSHPDEWFCSTEQKWKPKSEFNLHDEANGLPQWDCRDCQQERGRDRYRKNKDQVKNINRVAKLNSREENREYLNKVIERNIRTIIHLRTKAAPERSLQGRIADVITSFSGRMIFAYLQIVWFGIWILLNTGRFGLRAFDPFPYGLLTMVVSLEAIFLSTFVLISQNCQGEETERRADLDLHIGLLTEHELTRVPRINGNDRGHPPCDIRAGWSHQREGSRRG